MSAPSLRTELQQQPPTHDFGGEITALEIRVEWMRYCDVCDSDQIFIAKESCNLGLIGRCQKCGETRLARFTHTNTGWEEHT